MTQQNVLQKHHSSSRQGHAGSSHSPHANCWEQQEHGSSPAGTTASSPIKQPQGRAAVSPSSCWGTSNHPKSHHQAACPSSDRAAVFIQHEYVNVGFLFSNLHRIKQSNLHGHLKQLQASLTTRQHPGLTGNLDENRQLQTQQ